MLQVVDTETANAENDSNIANHVPMTQPTSPVHPESDEERRDCGKGDNYPCHKLQEPKNGITNEQEAACRHSTTMTPSNNSDTAGEQMTAACGDPNHPRRRKETDHNISLKAKMPTFGICWDSDQENNAGPGAMIQEIDGSDNDGRSRMDSFVPLTQAAGSEMQSDSSSSSSSSSDSDGSENDSDEEENNDAMKVGDDDSDSDGENGKTLEEIGEAYRKKREANLLKHTLFAKNLGLLKSPPNEPKTIPAASCQTPNSRDPCTPTPQKTQPNAVRGMLFATPYNMTRSNHHKSSQSSTSEDLTKDEAAILQELEEFYPHRQSQVRHLWSLLSPALASSNSTGLMHRKYIPPPIFVTGPAGTGKTCIVRNVVTRLQQTLPPNAEHRSGCAYINCATLEGSIDEIVHSAYRQLALDLKTRRTSSGQSHRKRKRKRTKRANKPSQQMVGAIARMAEDTVTSKRQCTVTHAHGTETGPSRQATECEKPELEHGKQQSSVTEGDCSKALSAVPVGKKVAGKIERHDGGSGSVYEATAQKRSKHEVTCVRRSSRLKESEDKDNDYEDAENAIRKTSSALAKEVSLDMNTRKTAAAKEGDLTVSTTPVSTTAQIAAANFGREVQQTLFQHSKDNAFLILDQAERLLSLSSSPSGTSGTKSNFLAQLLLLPRIYNLNLTIIVVTKSVLLEHSRFNNLVNPERSLSTISSAIQPLKVNFQAYKGKETFKQILLQPNLLKRIIGPDMLASYLSAELDGDDSFARQIVRSFLNTLVQTLYGSIRDLKEFVRLGRSLWPPYVQPLQSHNLRKTLNSIQKRTASNSSLSQPKGEAFSRVGGKHVISYLDQQILPQIRAQLEHALYSLTDGQQVQENVAKAHTASSSSVGGKYLRQNNAYSSASSLERNSSPDAPCLQETAYLSKCLMLAAYICQNNKADKDKQLFTIQKSGKKNSANKKASQGEDLAYGNTRDGAPRSFRPRLFPMERMLSVFISIVGLNQDQRPADMSAQLKGDYEIEPSNIGSSDFFESLSHLRDVGVLHDRTSSANGASAADEVNLSAPKYWCSLTRDEADAIAKSIRFPLENYLY